MGDDNIAENYLLLFDDDDDDDEKKRREKHGKKHGTKHGATPRPADASGQRRPIPSATPPAAPTSAGSARRMPATDRAVAAAAIGGRKSLWSRFWRWLRHG